jgi:hypothetical protein
MRVAFVSRRPFADGPVRQPFLESDPANIAYVLGGTYFSHLTLRRLSHGDLRDKLQPFDLVFVPLDVRAFDTVQRILDACRDRAACYSEGGIADYQMLSPGDQVTYVQIINSVTINFLYWARYVPFYRSLTNVPTEYLPYPYLLEEARKHALSGSGQLREVTLPSGLTGATRNGLGSLAVSKELLRRGLIDRVNCWLTPETFAEDAEAIAALLSGKPSSRRVRTGRPNWRRCLARSGVDYRRLLQLKTRLGHSRVDQVAPPLVHSERLTFHRRQRWTSYLKVMAQSLLVVDMNNRETVGRNALDCAALGVVCVSTDRSDMQRRLFPETTLSDSWDVQGAVELCERLLSEPDFLRSVVDYAARAVEEFDCAAFARRFDSLVARYPDILGRGRA